GRLRGARKRAKGGHRVLQYDRRQLVAFEQIQHETGRTDLKEKRSGQHIGVTVDQVESAKTLWVGERFVTQVKDRAIVLNPLEAIIHDEIRALTELEGHRLLGIKGLFAKRVWAAAANPAGPCKQNPQGQEGQERVQILFRPRHGSVEGVV